LTFQETAVESAFIIDPEKREDDRGFFARTWCVDEFAAHGLHPRFVQGNVGHSAARGTLRGLHYQVPPHEEAKLVRCTAGAVWDVVVDVRPDSPTFGRWVGVELSSANHRMLYVPEGCAHGYQALEDGSEVFYLVTNFYAPGHERGVRFDDPFFGIEWPLPVSRVSDKDRSHPDFNPGEVNA
jgi:dTDP-4-dehydrorhamnose 3,5-epimerase